MTVPDPTSPTAEDVIARVVLPKVGNQCVCTMFGGKGHNVNPPCGTVRASHDLAAAVVAAIRGMSVETLAEMIGGEVEAGPVRGIRAVGPWQVTP